MPRARRDQDKALGLLQYVPSVLPAFITAKGAFRPAAQRFELTYTSVGMGPDERETVVSNSVPVRGRWNSRPVAGYTLILLSAIAGLVLPDWFHGSFISYLVLAGVVPGIGLIAASGASLVSVDPLSVVQRVLELRNQHGGGSSEPGDRDRQDARSAADAESERSRARDNDGAIDDIMSHMTSGVATRKPASGMMARRAVPLRRRKVDWILLAFFAVNLLFITYFIDIEQLTIANPYHFSYPAWPPHVIVNLIHSYGTKYDPLLMARPAFWRMTIWIDVLWNGPFYLAAIYALSRGREWIRVPALVWSGSMSAVVLIILAEEYNGSHASPHFAVVLALNIPWLALPLGTIIRMSRPHPFTEPAADQAPKAGRAVPVPTSQGDAVTANSASPPGSRIEALASAEQARAWYAANAKSSRLRFQVSEVVVLLVAAAVPVTGIVFPHDARPPAIIGAVVVVLTGLRSVFHWQDNWTRFMTAYMSISAEVRLYEAGVSPYQDLASRDALLIGKINSIELSETRNWSALTAPGADADATKPAPTATG